LVETKVNKNTAKLFAMRFKIFSLIFFSVLFLFGQEPDSLLAQYQSYPNDTAKVNLLYKKGFALRNSDLSSAIKFSQACYQTALLTKNNHYIAKALNLQAVLKAQIGMHGEAASDLKKALQLRIQTCDTLSQAIILNNLGNIYSNTNDNWKALTCYENSLRLLSTIQNDSDIIEIDRWTYGGILGIASLQVKMKTFKLAEENFETLVHPAEENRDYEMLLECYKNIGLCKLNLGDTLAAECYELMAIDVMEISEDTLGKADCYVNLGKIYLAKKNFKESFSCLQKALVIAQRNNYNEGLLNAWRGLAEYYSGIKNFKEAYFYLAKHDSVLTQNSGVAFDNLSALWNENSTAEIKTETSFFSVKSIFQLILIGAVILILGFFVIRKGNEQKGQEK